MNKENVRTWTTIITALGVATAAMDYLSAIINLVTAILSLLSR